MIEEASAVACGLASMTNNKGRRRDGQIEVIGIDRVCLGVSVLIVWDLNDVGK